MSGFDDLTTRALGYLAGRSSRRGALARIGRVLVGAAVLPVLPVARGRAAEGDAPEERCDYWKYCSADGFLCTCCGGGITECPPGTSPSKLSWVGTCHNPEDKKDYLISYTDCCGGGACNRCNCTNSQGERPGYAMGLHNDVNWCMGNESTIYNCTIVLTLGEA